ncbi:hypothetical protein BDW59DRAFT_142441 [Aspergillus cavernicola]|uniref:AB hydrolase-1 domain-containing protein n=1 Tax=Aspergillus cavernicola TaxID=176166 RepID=A0ABR4IPU9_9EURO
MATIVLIPGAWFTPAIYEPFLKAFNSHGHPTHYAGYPSLDPINPTIADCKTDTDVIARTLRSLVEDEGRDIVLVMHSYAGMPGAAAAKGLGKVERKREGRSGGVLGMVFIAAFLVPEGASCAGLQGGSLPDWILLDNPFPDLNIPKDPVGDFAQPAPAWADDEYAGRLAMIVTTADKAVPQEAQHGMVTATQKEWIIKEIQDCTHCGPFMNRLGESVGLILAILDRFAAQTDKVLSCI